MTPLIPAILLAAATLFAPVPTHATDLVTACGQSVRGNARLTGNLDCSATDDDAVKLQGRLHLEGFTLTAHPAHAAVRCLKGACRIDGPGTITGGAYGIRSDKNTKLIEVTISNNPGAGVRALKKARIDASAISNNGGIGVDADKINAYASSFLGNGGDGAHTVRKAILFGCNVAGNAGDGVTSDRLVKVSHNTTVTGNGLDGVDAGRIMVKRNAEVTANGTSVTCGVAEACDDLASERKPIVNSGGVCGTSRNPDDGTSWGVCAGD